MSGIREEIEAFRARIAWEQADARQMVALQLACGIDLREAMLAGPERRTELLSRLQRAIERERLKGLRRHWSYDLNRHIALKQALDRLKTHETPGRESMPAVEQRARLKHQWHAETETAPEGAV
jgi:DNA-binding transcriptional regulator YbjK